MGKRHRASEVAVTIEAMAPSGEGIGRIDGRAVFVAGTLVGERVRIRYEQTRVLRGKVLQITDPSDARIEPACPIARRCGGCDFMHARLPAQQQMHQTIVREVMGWQGELPIHQPCPPQRYRTRARLALRAKGQHVTVGYHRHRSRELTAAQSCLVLVEPLEAVLTQLPSVLGGSHGQGEAQLSLGSDGRPVIELRWRGDLHADVFAQVSQQVAEGRWAGVRIWPQDSNQPLCFGEPRPEGVGADGATLRYASGGFAQASAAGGVALAKRVAELAPSGGRIVELFAGSGTLSIMLAPKAERYVAVEQDPAAVEALRENLRARGHKVHIKSSDANLFELPRPVATVVLDPPRAGASGAMQRIVKGRPSVVVYVS